MDRDEIVADFAQFYSLIISPVDQPTDIALYATLWSQLPRESRCVRKYNPDALWSDIEGLLWSIEFSLRVLTWQPTKDGRKGRNRPKPLQRPGERIRNQQHADNALANKSEIANALGITEEV